MIVETSIAAAATALSDWESAHPENEARRKVRVRREAKQRNAAARQEADQKDKQLATEKAYLLCLREKSALLADASIEPAETVVKAAIAACYTQRQQAINSFPNPEEGNGVMDAFDEVAQKDIILTIIMERARSAAAKPAPAPATPKPRDTGL